MARSFSADLNVRRGNFDFMDALSRYVEPIALGQPCGPDLYESADFAFVNFLVTAEGLLPASFYARDGGAPFDRSSIDFEKQFAAADALLRKTHDLRLLSILAKFHALNRDLAKSVQQIELIANLMDTFWDDVHPRPEGGDPSYRMACLQALDDNTHIVLPMQHAPLLTHRRAGALTLRTIFIATGQVEPRDGETPRSASEFDRTIDEIDINEILEAQSLFSRLGVAVDRLRQTWLDHAGYNQALRFDLVAPFAAKARAALAALAARRRPPVSSPATATAAISEEVVEASPGSGSSLTGSVANFSDASNALAAAADFFARHEPSNPALLLIRQAQQLVGRSFVEILQVLAPDHVAGAHVNIGRDQFLQLPIERLQGFATVATGDRHDQVAQDFVAANRQDAVKLLAMVGSFYALHEPSSPLPLFIDKARALIGRDFLGIIKDMLPVDAFKSVERNIS